MTLRVKIENDGNNPDDKLVIRGVKYMGGHGPDQGGNPGGMAFIEATGNDSDYVLISQGEAVYYNPPTNHFDEFDILSFKGQHS